MSSFIFLVFVFLFDPPVAAREVSGPEESFLNCFHDRHPDASTGIVHARGSEAYNAIYRSNIQNVRFLYSAAAKPAVLVTPASESHVQSSVICGKTSRLRVRVRSGGHDYEGMSYVSEGEGFLVVDLVNLRSLTVDIAKGSAWVAAGATPDGRLPRRTMPTVGVGGHFSGGGIGTMLRKYGTAADNIIDARLVDAQGRLLDRSSMGEDLFWAVRGGGGASFGVIVSYKVRLVYVPPTVTVFTVGKNLEQNATQILNRWQHVATGLDENLFIRVIAEATDAPQSPMGRTVHLRFNSLFLGTRDELLPLMRRNFPDLGLKAEDCKEMTWIESTLYFAGLSGRRPEALLDRSPEFNSSFKAKSDFHLAVPHFVQGEPAVIIMDPFGGKMDEIPETAIAFPHRRGNLFNIQYFMRWFETEDVVTRGHLDWMRKLYAFMEPYVSSNPRAAYVNYRDVDLGTTGEASTVAATWGTQYFMNNFQRLAAVKSSVDHDNFFRNEQSIPP
ncbi:unnamed protein product [Spirodela intermedia]|uniref:FAD-binding PCMH-type domain-containing protein n=1 Tax=Spirodela intermedia TaxID=51605 RepID=A0A7I8IJC4_SPIIN|nr:unnamed protein product [Spirodela intermedia]CAA6657987.1 unnamed protein product [Spirodela intermedia]